MALIECPECGGKVSDKALACIHCGYPLKKEKIKYCLHCGKENDEDSDFCAYCGNSFISNDTKKEIKEGKSLSSADSLLDEVLDRIAEEQELEESELEKIERKRLEEDRRRYDNMAKCPKCGSTSLSGNKKGFGVGKALVGLAITGGVGLLAGGIGANKVIVTCMNCGHTFTIN